MFFKSADFKSQVNFIKLVNLVKHGHCNYFKLCDAYLQLWKNNLRTVRRFFIVNILRWQVAVAIIQFVFNTFYTLL